MKRLELERRNQLHASTQTAFFFIVLYYCTRPRAPLLARRCCWGGETSQQRMRPYSIHARATKDTGWTGQSPLKLTDPLADVYYAKSRNKTKRATALKISRNSASRSRAYKLVVSGRQPHGDYEDKMATCTL